jgi:imidazole glycerol-phosphate synthase subunit HisF
MTMRKRIIPVLQINNGKLVKTTKFKNPKYIGDPINAVKIFNEKDVDELILLDISATANRREPNYDLIHNIASEAFMPLCYGGGVGHIEQIKKLFSTGIEKIAINNINLTSKSLIREASETFGSQSIVASINMKNGFFVKTREYVFDYLRMRTMNLDPLCFIKELENAGAGEILVCSVDRDGMMNGYDLGIIKKLSETVDVPVIALGGAGNLAHIQQLLKKTEASAAAAGSLFVFHGPHKAVLINYPDENQIEEILDEQ